MTSADQRDQLLALAQRCEHTGRPDRNLDADIYEALGFTVRRKPTNLLAPRTPPGGIYQQGSLWKAIGRVSAEIDVAVSIIRQKAPEWNWSLQSVATEEQTFEALVAGCSGQGALASLALCAALLKAFARSRADQPSTQTER
ncbi:hypothetical protein QO058_27635 [Bosea vestrisii]|uniref:hypothetical protein n=1 Tax=Bosea vestrisii TaxID=151416 RepID=UPI0024DFD78D|nr:hypothetical protein [Bosea vestrisii]WID96447.1 hypothetical protein QO058_27635 [Bosea vestrisii]